jgi:hypothetical protein
MVRCEACLRTNPPTRATCLYCATPLPQTDASITLRKPTLKPLETWEQGYSNIVLPRANDSFTDDQLGQLSNLLHLELGDVRRIIAANCPLPLARVSSFAEAKLIENSLQNLGVETGIVSDMDLRLATLPPVRIRALEVEDSGLVAYQMAGEEKSRVPWGQIFLFVLGRLFVRRVELKERKGRRSEGEILNASELSADKALVDLYTSANDGGWRITAEGFDFSCLGDQKGLLAADNFSRLINFLCERAVDADYDDSYLRLRQLLELIWPSPKQTASRGWQREGFGRYSVGEVTESSNESQFTRYSRLLYYLRTNAVGQTG